MASVAQDVPALQPPAGQAPNFDHPWSIQGVYYAFLSIALPTTTLSMAARTYTRFRILSDGSWDYYFMLLGWLAYVPYCAISFHLVKYGAGVHQWDVRSGDLPAFSYWVFVMQMFYDFTISQVKISICLQVLKLFVGGRNREFWAIWIFICIQVLWFLANFLENTFSCKPIQKNWEPERDGTCLPGADVKFLAVGVFNVVSDIMMWTYPLVRAYKLTLSLRKRLSVAAIFLVGLLAIVGSVLRTAFSIRYFIHEQDKTFVLSQLVMSTHGEIASGIIAGNSVTLPIFWRCVKKFWRDSRTRNESDKHIASNEIQKCESNVERVQHISKTVSDQSPVNVVTEVP